MRAFRIGIAATVMAALGVFAVAPAEAALLAQELKCSATLAKSLSKYHASVLKVKAKCHNDDISGKANDDDACETLSVAAQASIDKARAKFMKKVAKDCTTTCSLSDDIRCVTNMGCPARHLAAPPNNAVAETCSGSGGSNPFNIRNLGWPGPYCDEILGHPILSVEDFGECVLTLADTVADVVDEFVYAGLDETSGLSGDAAKCLSSIAKASAKALGKPYLEAAACRDTRFQADQQSTPIFACALQDPDTIAVTSAAVAKVIGTVEKKCANEDIVALTGLCGSAAPTTVTEAQDCVSGMVAEVANSERGVHRHVHSPLSLINVSHPRSAKAWCGDGFITRTREEHTGVGEECDGSDAPCGGGSCFPPGDLFECTCDNVVRERFVVNGDESATDSDAGWNGASHNATHLDSFGYVSAVTNCTCDAFSQATCTSPSGDDVCDVRANMGPRCSDDLGGTQTCDQRGNNNGSSTNADCFVCDDNSLNAGTACANGTLPNETLCQSQCIVDATGLPVMPQTPCIDQTGCAEGQTCRGRCNNTLTCETMTEGSPLPLISAENPVCVMLEFRTDVTGTKNIVTGETAVTYQTRSSITLGALFTEPCPVCAGICINGANNGNSCSGRCDSSAAECLFDSDCTGPGDTACLESNADCPSGFCSLDLRCSHGLNEGGLCRPDTTTLLGTVSHDCELGPSTLGVDQPFGTVTTEEVEFPVGGACTDPAWTNYTCPCPADVLPHNGVPTKPNSCSAACDGGVNAGQGCGTGGGGTGSYTVCVGGGDNNKPCDDDLDCDSLSCSGQALHCTAGTASLIGQPCTVNAQCGGGGVCGDPCPGGRCVPLCLEQGECNNGARDGDPCSTLDHCKQCTAGNPSLIGVGCDTHSRCNTTTFSGDGLCEAVLGVTCDVSDPEDGLCASGPSDTRCNGAGFTTVPCELEYGTCESNVCTDGSPAKRGLACVVGSDCVDIPNVPVSSGCETGNDSLPGTADDIPGAGECELRPTDCFVNNGHAEGGDTLNGEGSPSDVNVNACFCVPPGQEDVVNDASGFGGPSRIRRQGSATMNVPSIP
jgi:hypothetical protein